ncbi:hypothetical protein AM493_13905 [Flavobacterium akiainvivens]|uniref:Uncharacterized protein n=1 Tax=Flavobacterium akiainvivens TaxID=1202724 RepID=A0A0M8ME70_9FLAO|nr:hypothetical protein [Flavobacterium akiainvivens]KOS07004.1 hypothetical protein AM493_13905 [Flavobacterium akiainvivens]SFQ59307.1 hypothetical protein SAMN05444144_10996 [Flavobacterium akiainvivens]
MAKDKIILAELDFDTKNLVKAAQDTKKEMEALMERQEKLAKKGKESSAEFIRNEAVLKSLTRAYEEQSNAIAAHMGQTEKMGATFNDFKTRLGEAFNSINIFNGGLGDFLSRAKEAGGTGKLFKGAVEGMTTGIKGMGAAIKANPLGAFLSIIGFVIDKLLNFTPLTNAMQKAFAALAPVIEWVNKPIELLAGGIEAIAGWLGKLTGATDDAAQGLEKIAQAQSRLNSEMILQEELNNTAKKQVDQLIAKSRDQTLSEKERIKALQDAAAVEQENYNQRRHLSEEAYRIAQAKLQQEKKLSDDEMLILENGTAAQIAKLQETRGITAEELKTLQDAKVEKQRIVDEEVTIKKRQSADEKSVRDQVKAQDAAAAREAEATRQKQYDKALERQRQLLDLFVAESGTRGKTLAQQLKYEEDYATKSIALLKEQLRLKKITTLEFQIAEENINTQSQQNMFDITNRFAKAQLDLELQRSKSLFENAEKIDEELVVKENERLAGNLKKKEEQLAKELKIDDDLLKAKGNNLVQMSTEELQYLKEVEAMHAEHEEAIAQNNQKLKDFTAATEEKEAAKKQQKRADEAAKAEEEYQARLEKAQTEYDAQVITEEAHHQAYIETLKQQLEDKKITQEQYNALETEAVKQKEQNIRDIEKARLDNKLQMASQSYSQMAEIFGKESKAGKAFSAAAALIDTYQAATKALAASPPPFNYVAAATVTATGLRNVAKITSSKQPKFEQGGLVQVGGNRHSAGGTLFTGADGTRFEAEQGELIGVMNRNAARHFMAFNNAFPAGGSTAPNYFANGGIVSREIAQQQLNVDELAGKIALANAALPQPVVAVQDIITQGNSYVQVRDGANF